MASVEGTLSVKHLAEEAKEEEKKPEDAKSEEEEEEDKEDEEKENPEEESDGSEASKSEDDEKGAEKKGADKIRSSPVTPSASLRPTRERKTVDRFYATPTERAATKSLSIQRGRGMQLKDIPNVAYKLSKRKADENLQILHSILYGKRTKAYNLKKNIGQFSGYLWDENEHEKQRGRIQDKFDKCVKEKLLDFCDVLNLPVKSVAKKDELCLRLLEFLESPHATTDLLLADKKKKSKKQKSKATKLKSSIDRTAPSKKRKLSSERNEEADNTGDESQEDDQNEDAEEESDLEGTDSEQEEAEKSKEEQNEKISSKKDSGTKMSAKRQKVGKDNGKDKNISVKEKASSRKLSKKDGKPRNVEADIEPSKEEIYTAAVNILKNVDFDTATLSDIIRQLGTHFGVDLMHKKAEVKAIVTDAINNMSDDEGEDGDNGSED